MDIVFSHQHIIRLRHQMQRHYVVMVLTVLVETEGELVLIMEALHNGCNLIQTK